ncbi:anhydro-N-acetylmuramic acid kinase [Actinocatenispora comari]|uniref:Anhydro-N-acetylmuramic acid kinase n=1 Tax=Actinocatenispora comari TaxID=2807577 RepID=A0A8J4ABF4_9ACTN|nr:anhydro-N-acetylmuramic acid kinase [Actinocatenispora comari]GIL26607.1 anhydro-N-acetylmuramic acid kinase [Actinocatenispora comari]
MTNDTTTADPATGGARPATTRVVGLMSGTSYDAIDLAAAEFERAGDTLLLRPLGALGVGYDEDLRAAIGAILPPAPTTVEAVCRLTTRLGHAYAAAARRAVTELCGGRADLVCSHGQTVYHWVEQGRALGTLQLGEPAWLAAATGLPVVSDVRSADLAAGGQGAPLVPMFDALLLTPDAGGPRRAALNLGGIANITVLPDAGRSAASGAGVLGYDTGPANALIDVACERFFGEPYDAAGHHAAAGTVLPELLAALLAEPYYAAPAPKSTGKELFHPGYLDGFLTGDERGEDVVATLTELTARTVADQLRAHRIAEVVAAGGGLRNPVLTDRIAALAGCRLVSIDAYGIDPDAKEAYAFALLGWLTWHGLPGALPSVTGADRPAVLGSITPGTAALRLPPPAEMPARLRLV